MVVKREMNLAMLVTEEKCGFLEVEEGTGKLSKEEFDALIYDLNKFLGLCW
jgi:hypothetical protein